MPLFVLSDTHLSSSSGKPMDVFGSRWINYTDKLVKGWNSAVSDNDTVVVGGDISWAMNLSEAANDLKLLNSLNGTKIISRGNHDYWWPSQKKLDAFFSENNINTIKVLQNNAYLCEGKLICGSRGWFNDEKTAPKETDYKKIVAREVGRIELSIKAGQKLIGESGEDNCEQLIFLHFPPVFRDSICREIVDILHKYGIKRCFYGHIHKIYDIPYRTVFEDIEFIITSADYLNFIPFLIR